MHQCLNGAIHSRKCSIMTPTKWRSFVYILTEICHQRSKWLGPKPSQMPWILLEIQIFRNYFSVEQISNQIVTFSNNIWSGVKCLKYSILYLVSEICVFLAIVRCPSPSIQYTLWANEFLKMADFFIYLVQLKSFSNILKND